MPPSTAWLSFISKTCKNGLTIHFAYTRIGEEEIPVNVAYSSWSTDQNTCLITLFKKPLKRLTIQEILAEIEDMVETIQ